MLLYISKRTEIKGMVCSSFLIFYGSIRFIIEFYRQPDAHIGYVAFDSISMGQLLCIPMIIIGFFILIYSRKNA
jgi:phosphatidylglycerol:prolipoprotein diacylglycerol transferase